MIAIVPARGGSRGVLRKNICLAGGKPLIAWTIDAAKASNVIDRTIVSTDDDEIADVAIRHGAEVPFLRPADLATDTATSTDVVAHALRAIGCDERSIDTFALLQPTSPLRTSADIDAAAMLMNRSQAMAVASVTPVAHPIQWLRRVNEEGLLETWSPQADLTRRQEMEPLFELNGAIYLGQVARFLRYRSFTPSCTAAYVMPRHRSIDIDDEFDLKLCDLLLASNERDI